jgi:hypothetical protein
MVCSAALPLLAMAGSPSTPMTLSNCRPKWAVGDWWIVESQRYDRGENRAGATPGWLEKENWRFSVDRTNSIEGEPCYEVSVKPQGQNLCPYSFVYSFRISDLLVMRRELRQPSLGKTGRGSSAPIVESNYSKDEEMPFLQPDFPNLPLAGPHFAGGATNSYRATAFSQRNPQPNAGATPKCSRLFTGSLNQSFQPGAKLAFESSPGAKSFAPQSNSKSGVVVLAPSTDKFERQSWDSARPWSVYSEKWEFGELVRKSWLTDYGHTDSATTAQPGGAK